MPRKPARPAVQDIVAERVFQRVDGKEVRAIVGRPRKTKQDWVCEFQVLGVGHSKVYKLEGIDSLQALQMALGMMVVQLESYQDEHGLTFMGETGLMLMRPDFDAMRREAEASPDYHLWKHVFDDDPYLGSRA
jgi:hypothetical protein